MGKHLFDDNRLVATPRGSRGEFLSVAFREPSKEETGSPWVVAITRYCVPGRCDTYRFDYAIAPSGYCEPVRYSSEAEETIDVSLRKLRRDLDKPGVVKMFEEVAKGGHFKWHVRTLTERLLSVIAPKTKSYRALVRVIAQPK